MFCIVVNYALAQGNYNKNEIFPPPSSYGVPISSTLFRLEDDTLKDIFKFDAPKQIQTTTIVPFLSRFNEPKQFSEAKKDDFSNFSLPSKTTTTATPTTTTTANPIQFGLPKEDSNGNSFQAPKTQLNNRFNLQELPRGSIIDSRFKNEPDVAKPVALQVINLDSYNGDGLSKIHVPFVLHEIKNENRINFPSTSYGVPQRSGGNQHLHIPIITESDIHIPNIVLYLIKNKSYAVRHHQQTYPYN